MKYVQKHKEDIILPIYKNILIKQTKYQFSLIKTKPVMQTK